MTSVSATVYIVDDDASFRPYFNGDIDPGLASQRAAVDRATPHTRRKRTFFPTSSWTTCATTL